MAVTVLIVDDNAQFRVLLREIVAAEPDCHVVGEAADGAEAMRPRSGTPAGYPAPGPRMPRSTARRSCGGARQSAPRARSLS